MSESEFRKVERTADFCEAKAITFTKRNEVKIGPLIPTNILPGLLKVKTFLYLHVTLEEEKLQLMVDSLNGLETTAGQDEYEGQYLLQFQYFHPKTNCLEANPRKVLVTDIYYGIHPLHQNEKPDYYIVGEDSQYSQQPKIERIRNFPFWRVGIYGNPEEQAIIFNK